MQPETILLVETGQVNPHYSLSVESGRPDKGKVKVKGMERSLSVIQGKGLIKLHLDRLDLSAGQYFVNVGVYEQNWNYAYDYHWHVYPLLINSKVSSKSILNPPLRWEIGSVQAEIAERLDAMSSW